MQLHDVIRAAKSAAIMQASGLERGSAWVTVQGGSTLIHACRAAGFAAKVHKKAVLITLGERMHHASATAFADSLNASGVVVIAHA